MEMVLAVEKVIVKESGDGREVVLACAAVVRALLEQVNHPQDFARHQIPESKLPEIAAAVAHDPLAAFLPLPQELIETVCRRACGWS